MQTLDIPLRRRIADALPLPVRIAVRMARDVTVILLIAGVLFLPFLGVRELSSSHEGRAAINATVVLERGCWGLPRLFDEQIELQKPPLYYWLVSLIGGLRGQVDAWAVRLPAALAAIGCLLWLYLLIARTGRTPAGLLAALILATTLHFTWLAQVGRVDMPLTLTVAVGLGALLLGGDGRSWKLTGYVALGLGVLCKGPIALALAVVAGLAVAVAECWPRLGNALVYDVARWIRRTSLGWGLAVITLVAAPWFVWANWETAGRQLEVFFWHHNLERGFGLETLAAHPLAAHPWWFYLVRFWIDLAPWSLLFPAALYWTWKHNLLRDDRLCRIGLVWFAAMFVFLSCMRFKRADYLLPAYPGVALYLGAVGQHWLREVSAARRRWVKLASAVFIALYAAGWTAHQALQAAEQPYCDAAQRIRRHAGQETPIIFFRTELHPLAFHLGRPMTTVLEWENLAIWASEPRPIWFVMSTAHFSQRRHHLDVLLEPVLTLDDLPEHRGAETLMVLRNLRPIP